MVRVSDGPVGAQQLELLRAAARSHRPKPPDPPAAELPVARVVVDVPHPHLDRLFDYTVPATMADTARPGVRVRVRFAGQDVDGFVAERVATSGHDGRLSPIRRLVSPEPVLSPQVAGLARAVADAYAGTLGDVLRLAVPPRHARTENETPPPRGDELPLGDAAPGPWAAYPAGPALVARLAAGESPRAAWTALPGTESLPEPRVAARPHWAVALATAVHATLASGRGSLVVLPDRRDVDAVDAALAAALGPGRHVRLEADLGPTARYRAFLALRRGHVKVAVGTRAAAFAPVTDLGLVAIWDDGDDLHVEQRAPYPHAREVLALRAVRESAAMIAGGFAVSAEVAAWVRSGWARPVAAERPVLRARRAAVAIAASEPGAEDDPAAAGRLPATAWRAIRDGLGRGPVLVQVPRAGYVPGMSCQTCRRAARCPACHGPVSLARSAGGGGAGGAAGVTGAAPGTPACGWCGRSLTAWECPHCGGRRLRARSVGVHRTAEELGRAFTGVPVVVPRAGEPAPAVPPGALVVATPGLEPPAPGGYAAAVLLDGGLLLERPDLRASEDALRRWSAAVALVRPAGEAGRVVLAADPQAPAAQALVRGDAAGHAERELGEREELGLPPAVAMASITGGAAAVRAFVAALEPPPTAELLGPLAVEPAREGREGEAADAVRMLARCPRPDAGALAAALHAAAAVRSARRDQGAVRVQVDPRDVG
jgi:primosomal protein N' (replication factor Y)